MGAWCPGRNGEEVTVAGTEAQLQEEGYVSCVQNCISQFTRMGKPQEPLNRLWFPLDFTLKKDHWASVGEFIGSGQRAQEGEIIVNAALAVEMRNRQAWALSCGKQNLDDGLDSRERIIQDDWGPICAAGWAELHLCVRDYWKVEQKSWAKVALNWTKLDGFQGIAWGRAVGNEVRGVIGEGRWYRSPGKGILPLDGMLSGWDAINMRGFWAEALQSDLGFESFFSIWRKDSRRTRLTSGRSWWQLQ